MSKKYRINIFFLFLSVLSLVLPVFVCAQTGGGSPTGITWECVKVGAGPGGADVYGNCTFDDLVLATQNVVNWAVRFALFFSVIVIAYAGFILLTSEGNPSKLTKAKKMFQSVAIGIVLVIAAWLIVNLITTILLGKPLTTILQIN